MIVPAHREDMRMPLISWTCVMAVPTSESYSWRLDSSVGCLPALSGQHTLRCFQFSELARQLFALSVDARERLTDPLLFPGDLVQCRHGLPWGNEYRSTKVDLCLRLYHYYAEGAITECAQIL